MENQNLFKKISEAQNCVEQIKEWEKNLKEKRTEVNEALEVTKNSLSSGVIKLVLNDNLSITISFFDKINIPLDVISPEGYYGLLANCFRDETVNAAIAKTENSEIMLQNMAADYKFLWNMKEEAKGVSNG